MCNYFGSTYYTIAYTSFVLIQGYSNKIQNPAMSVNASKYR